MKLWDVRMLAEISTLETGKYPANKCAFDPSGQVSAAALPWDHLVLACYAAAGNVCRGPMRLTAYIVGWQRLRGWAGCPTMQASDIAAYAQCLCHCISIQTK